MQAVLLIQGPKLVAEFSPPFISACPPSLSFQPVLNSDPWANFYDSYARPSRYFDRFLCFLHWWGLFMSILWPQATPDVVVPSPLRWNQHMGCSVLDHKEIRPGRKRSALLPVNHIRKLRMMSCDLQLNFFSVAHFIRSVSKGIINREEIYLLPPRFSSFKFLIERATLIVPSLL